MGERPRPRINERRATEIRSRLEAAPAGLWTSRPWIQDERERPPPGHVFDVGGPGVRMGHTEWALIADRGAREFVANARLDVEDLLHDLSVATRQRDVLVQAMERVQLEIRLNGRVGVDWLYEYLCTMFHQVAEIGPLPDQA